MDTVPKSSIWKHLISQFGNSDYDALWDEVTGYHAQTQWGYPPLPLTQFRITELAYLTLHSSHLYSCQINCTHYKIPEIFH